MLQRGCTRIDNNEVRWYKQSVHISLDLAATKTT